MALDCPHIDRTCYCGAMANSPDCKDNPPQCEVLERTCIEEIGGEDSCEIFLVWQRDRWREIARRLAGRLKDEVRCGWSEECEECTLAVRCQLPSHKAAMDDFEKMEAAE